MPVDRRWADAALIVANTRYGSARLFAPNMLVTSAHVLDKLEPGQRVKVQILGDRNQDGSWPEPREAKLVWQGVPSADMALLELLEDPPVIPAMEASFASLDMIEEVRTLAIGFPEGWLAGDVLRPYPVFGQLRPADVGGGYLWTVAAADKPNHVTQWAGLSGTSLIAPLGGDHLLLFGIVEEVPANFSGGLLKVVDFVTAQRLADFSPLTAAIRTYTWRNGTPSLRIVIRAEGVDEEDVPPPRYRANWTPLIDDGLAVGPDAARNLDVALDNAELEAMLDRADRNYRNIKHKFASNSRLVADIGRSHDAGKAIAGRITHDVKSSIAYLKDSYIERQYWSTALDGFVSLMVNQAFSTFYTDGFFDGNRSRKAIVARTLGTQLADIVSVEIWSEGVGPLRVMAPLSFLNGVTELAAVGTTLSEGTENRNPAITALMSSIKEWDYFFNWDEKTEFWTRYVVPQAFAFGHYENLPKTPYAVLNIGMA